MENRDVYVHGPAVNVPSKIDCVCAMLPRLPSERELVPLKLKRSQSHKSYCLYDYVSPQMLTNPLYGDIQIADDWVENAITEDEELVMSTLEAA